MNIILVVGARPNFIKVAPLIRAIDSHNQLSQSQPESKSKSESPINHQSPVTNHSFPITIHYSLIHTGQHYDYEMSQVFFQDLKIPAPDIHLGIGAGTHAEQTGKIMMELEKILIKGKPDMVIVFGDVNSTLAAALAAAKLNIPIAHVEAGIRSYDMTMPEEINRLLTDHVSDYLFTTSKYDDDNLKKEGINKKKIYRVGNIMADSLLANKALAAKSDILHRLGLLTNHQSPVTNNQSPVTNHQSPITNHQSLITNHQSPVTNHQSPITRYVLLTLHRPSNVDHEQNLIRILNAVTEISKRIPVIFPAHPRTQQRLKDFGISLSPHPESQSQSESSSSSQSPITNHQSLITNHQSLITNHQSPVTNHQLLITNPLGYLDFLNLEMNASFVITDSGGVQVETTILGIPCLTILDSPVWRITHEQGTNILIGTKTNKLMKEAYKIIDSLSPITNYQSLITNQKSPITSHQSLITNHKSPPLWDGKTAERIIDIICQ